MAISLKALSGANVHEKHVDYKKISNGHSGNDPERISVDGQKDRLEISEAGRKRYSDTKNVTASSGNDILSAKKGSKDDAFVISFSDSGFVSRTIDRGYIEIQGVKINLSDEDKKRLSAIDKEAENKRMSAFLKTHMEHEQAVMKQQSETLSNFSKKVSRVKQTAQKLSQGQEVTPKELKELIETDPEAYAQAMMARQMKDAFEKSPHNKRQVSADISEAEQEEDSVEGVSWDDFEQTGYQVQMQVDLSNKEPEIDGMWIEEFQL